jgi:hypothetical protein
MATRAPKHGVGAKAHIEAVLGSSGSGKSHYVKGQIERQRPVRLIVFDPEDEWGDFGTRTGRVQDVAGGFEAAGQTGPCRTVFVPSPDPVMAVKQFDFICRVAFYAERCVFVVDELKSATTPSRSPFGWGMLSGCGRKRGINIYGLSQRSASIDKDFLGNCNFVRTGRLNYRVDAKAVADYVGASIEEIQNLPDYAWIMRNASTGAISRGQP